jgi:hypothetical protein
MIGSKHTSGGASSSTTGTGGAGPGDTYGGTGLRTRKGNLRAASVRVISFRAPKTVPDMIAVTVLRYPSPHAKLGRHSVRCRSCWRSGKVAGVPRKDAAQPLDTPISSGGTVGTGGVRGSGGVIGPGGVVGSGGSTTTGTGGRNTGGTTIGGGGGTATTSVGGGRTGGMVGSGGSGMGGVVGSGEASGTGGANSSGGVVGTGGVTTVGGSGGSAAGGSTGTALSGSGGSGVGGSNVTSLDAADSADSGAPCSADAILACSRGYFQTSTTPNSGVCANDSVDPACDNGTWTCPAGSIPTSRCTVALCPSTLPSGACTLGNGFSCSGYVYPSVNVICECLTGTWQCLM